MTYVFPAEWTRGKWMGYLREPVLNAVSIGDGCYQAVEWDTGPCGEGAVGRQFLLGHIYRWDEVAGRMDGPFMTREDTQEQAVLDEAYARVALPERPCTPPPRFQPRLLRNAALCTKCNTILESKHAHDYQGCACGNAVDGGLDYLRRVGCPEELEELSEWEEQ